MAASPDSMNNLLKSCIEKRFLQQFQEAAEQIATHEDQELRLSYGRQLKEALQKADELNVNSLINGVLQQIAGQSLYPATLMRQITETYKIDFPPICADSEVLAIAKRRGGQDAKDVIHAAFDYELTQTHSPKSSNTCAASIEIKFSSEERAAASRVFIAKIQNSSAAREDEKVIDGNGYLKKLINKYVAMCQIQLRVASASSTSSSSGFGFGAFFESLGKLLSGKNPSLDNGHLNTPDGP